MVAFVVCLASRLLGGSVCRPCLRLYLPLRLCLRLSVSVSALMCCSSLCMFFWANSRGPCKPSGCPTKSAFSLISFCLSLSLSLSVIFYLFFVNFWLVRNVSLCDIGAKVISQIDALISHGLVEFVPNAITISGNYNILSYLRGRETKIQVRRHRERLC